MRRFKKILKILACLLLLLLVASGAFFVHVWYFRPFNVNLFFARTALQFALESPELLSTIRVLEPMGIDFHNDDLDDASIAAGDRMFRRLRDAREVLRSYDDASLSDTDRRSKEIALSLLDLVAEAERFRFHNYPVNQMFGVQSGFPTFMQDSGTFTGMEGRLIYFMSGTSILIVVGVALDLVEKLNALLVMRNYEGFMKDTSGAGGGAGSGGGGGWGRRG